MKYLTSFIFFIILPACSGYQLSNYSNPLKKYDIDHLSVRSFYNESPIRSAGGEFTTQAYTALSELTGLRLSKKSQTSDAVLIGVVSSAKLLKEALRSSSKSVVDIPNRQRFQIAATNQLRLTVDYYIIKDSELKGLQLIRNVKDSRHIDNLALKTMSVFHKRVTQSTQVRRERYLDTGSKVNGTQNEKAIIRKVRELAQAAAYQLRDELLHFQQ